MGIFTIFLISISLAMDAFAVSISNGLAIKKINFFIALKFAIFFSVFQFLMPIIGFFSAKLFRESIIALDHWIAFILLTLIGSKMIYETFKEDEQEYLNKEDILAFNNLLILSIATSIDALAVGVSFAFISTNILYASSIIGIITFILSFFGVYIGGKIGGFFKKGAERLGGAILILIGIKILLEHLFS